MLELDDGSHLTESLAIIEYLEELHPNPPMIGTTPLERARVRALERICELGVLGRVATIFQNTHPFFAGRVKQSADAAETARTRLAANLKVLDAKIGSNPFVAGDKPTIADCTLLAALEFAEFAQVAARRQVNVHRWYETSRSARARRPEVPFDPPRMPRACAAGTTLAASPRTNPRSPVDARAPQRGRSDQEIAASLLGAASRVIAASSSAWLPSSTTTSPTAIASPEPVDLGHRRRHQRDDRDAGLAAQRVDRGSTRLRGRARLDEEGLGERRREQRLHVAHALLRQLEAAQHPVALAADQLDLQRDHVARHVQARSTRAKISTEVSNSSGITSVAPRR